MEGVLNDNKKVDEDGDLILCTLTEFMEAMEDAFDQLYVEGSYTKEGEGIHGYSDKIGTNESYFFFHNHVDIDNVNQHYIFVSKVQD